MCSIYVPKSSGKEGTVLLARPHCRNSLQRSQAGALATPASGSRGPAPGTLRSLLSHDCSNSRRMVQPFSSLPPFCAGDIIELAFASVRLCESEPRVTSHVKSMGDYGSFKILAKIAASLWVRVQTTHHCRALAHFFQKLFHRAEARRGSFPPLYLQPHTRPP
jgi:hypothetical protein